MEGLTKRASGVVRLVALGVTCLLLVASAGSASTNRFTYGNPAFCAPKKPVRDFGFSRLPAVREVPESAKELGYGAVGIYGGWSRVMSKSVPFGYVFSESDYSGDVHLDWTVTAQLWVVDMHGAPLREVDDDKLLIGRLNSANDPSIEVDPPQNRLGFYRFDMQIKTKSGEVIGSYGAYFKVVRPSWRPKLRLSRDFLRAGERLLIRVENHGSEEVSFGEAFGVQRLEEGRWTYLPDLPGHRWRMWLALLGAGNAGRCSALSLPADLPAGSYRIVKGVGTYRYPDGKHRQLAAPFEVIAPGADIQY